MSQFAWTGSDVNGVGLAGLTLGDASGNARAGYTNGVANNWITSVSDAQISTHKLYALSEELTVVPEPGSVILLSVVAVGLMSYRLFRKRKKANAS